MDAVVGGQVTITISSTPKKLTLKVNDPTYVDVDDDGDNDIIVTLLSILSTSSAQIKIEYLAQAAKETGKKVVAPSVPAAPAVEEAPAAETPVEETPAAAETAAAKPVSTTMILVVVVIIVLVGLGYWFTQKKGQVTPSYRSL